MRSSVSYSQNRVPEASIMSAYLHAARQLVKRIVPRGTWLFDLLEAVLHSAFSMRERRAERIFAGRMRASPAPFVIQIGANDGDDEFHDYVEQFEPNGVLVEPQKTAFADLRRAYAGYPGIVLENVAIAEEAGQRTLYMSKDQYIGDFPTSGLATLVPEKSVLAKEDAADLCSQEVSCITFDGLIRKHRVKDITYLQIDTEGYDYRIVRSIDLDRIRPDMIRYEYINLSDKEQSELLERLHDAGYLTLTLAIDVFAYLPESSPSGQ